jgi:IS5 family transposase
VIQLFGWQIEDALYEIDSVCRFAALAALPIDVLPGETTILKFRHWLEKHNLTAIPLNAANIRSKFWRSFCQ